MGCSHSTVRGGHAIFPMVLLLLLHGGFLCLLRCWCSAVCWCIMQTQALQKNDRKTKEWEWKLENKENPGWCFFLSFFFLLYLYHLSKGCNKNWDTFLILTECNTVIFFLFLYEGLHSNAWTHLGQHIITSELWLFFIQLSVPPPHQKGWKNLPGCVLCVDVAVEVEGAISSFDRGSSIPPEASSRLSRENSAWRKAITESTEKNTRSFYVILCKKS